MGFDGIFLHKLKNELNILKTGRISKIFELTSTNLIFQIRANKQNYNLNINLSPESSRIHITFKEFEHLPIKNNFYLFLKKNIEGFFISDIFQFKSDRILVLKLEGFSEMRDKVTNYLIIEVMGKYSNLILTDNNYIILDSLFHSGVNEFSRIIMPNKLYEFPETTKLNPLELSLDELTTIFKDNNINSPKDILINFLGVSYTLANMLYRDDNIILNFYNILHNDYIPSIFLNKQNKVDFYFYSTNPITTFSSLNVLLDEVYYDFDKKNQIKKETNDLLKFVTKQINKYETKILKLEKEYNNLDEANIYKLYGELLLSYKNLKEKANFVTVYNYYDNSEIKIDLDIKYTILDNSQRYYKKYQKIKKSLPYIIEQIDISKDELDYFKLLRDQILNANLNDILEINQELAKYNYTKTKQTKKKNQKPAILTYIVDDTLIVVGKNNIQNEYITHKLAKPNNLWFHVKDSSGSHVVILKDSDFTENEIRTAANLASLFSPLKDSSSVAVDYTKIRYIKSIPGKRKCFVTYTNQNTIYIDPDKELLTILKEKK